MNDFFWSVFEKSGSIDAFLAYRDSKENNNRKNDYKFINTDDKNKDSF